MDTTDIIKQLTVERNRIDAAIKLLSDFDTSTKPAKTPAKGNRKPISAAARKRISEAQRKRWATTNKGVGVITAKVATKAAPEAKKREMSAAARNRIVAAQKKRWEAIRSAKEATKKIPAKKVAKKAKDRKAVAPKKGAARKYSALKAKKTALEMSAPVSTEAALA